MQEIINGFSNAGVTRITVEYKQPWLIEEIEDWLEDNCPAEIEYSRDNYTITLTRK